MSTVSRVLVAAGVTLLVGAVLLAVWGIGRFAWIDGTIATMLSIRFYVVPVVIIALAVYLGWALFHGRFDSIKNGSLRGEKEPLVCDLDDKRIAGLCGGIAAYTGVDVVVIRVTALGFLVLVPAIATIAYLVGALAFRP